MAKVMIGDFELDDSSVDRFLTLTALGKLYGVSGMVIGRWLVECGLRERYVPTEGKPVIVATRKAKDGGFVKQAMAPNELPFDVWHEARTIRVLREAGHIVIGSE